MVAPALLTILAVALAGLQPVPAQAASSWMLVRTVSGLDQPIYMASPPADSQRSFIVEKGGVIRVLSNGAPLATPFLNMSSLVSTDGERGLLSMAFDPAYATNRRFYVYYTDPSGTIVIARYLSMAGDPNRADPASRHVLTTVPHPTYSNHNGGQLQFDPVAARSGSAMLYFATGDGGSSGDPNNNAQNLGSGLGKLFRIDTNAVTPKRVLFAYGLRNPWRFSFDRLNGDLRIGDVGQGSWEELDLIKHGSASGKNFGWRKYEGNHLYHNQTINSSQLTWPFWEYSHSGGNCAVVGGYLYRGSISSLYGYYLYADLCSGNIWMQLPGHAPIRMAISGRIPDIVSFSEDSHGELSIVSIDGAIWRLSPVWSLAGQSKGSS
jgi:glucose/arabinose dehydrogenase